MNGNNREMDLTRLNAEIFTKIRHIEDNSKIIIDHLYVNAIRKYANKKGITTSERLIEDLGWDIDDNGDFYIADRIMHHTYILKNNERIKCLKRDINKDMEFISTNLDNKIDFLNKRPSKEDILKFIRYERSI